MNSIDLGGHSGCGIFLIESDDGQNYVRKVSKDADYNARLKKQCEKQAAFALDGAIKTPRVLRSGIDNDGLYFFEMEYVQGITLAEYIRNMEIGKVKALVNAIVKNISLPGNEEESFNPNPIFTRKFEDLNEKLHGKDRIIDEAIIMLKNHDWSAFVPSFCHGDMTLENIIIKNDELYLIDFLDSFYDSYLLDLGTLLQDIQAMWSYRHDEKIDMNLVLRLIVFRDLLIDAIREKDERLVIEVYYALLQKLVRIVPYAKDAQTYQFLIDKISCIMREVA